VEGEWNNLKISNAKSLLDHHSLITKKKKKKKKREITYGKLSLTARNTFMIKELLNQRLGHARQCGKSGLGGTTTSGKTDKRFAA